MSLTEEVSGVEDAEVDSASTSCLLTPSVLLTVVLSVDTGDETFSSSRDTTVIDAGDDVTGVSVDENSL